MASRPGRNHYRRTLVRRLQHLTHLIRDCPEFTGQSFNVGEGRALEFFLEETTDLFTSEQNSATYDALEDFNRAVNDFQNWKAPPPTPNPKG